MKVKQVRKFIKRTNKVLPSIKEEIKPVEAPKPKTKTTKSTEKLNAETEVKNNEQKKENMTLEQIEKAEVLAQNLDATQKVKVVKKDKGLIERTESSKIVLTEDNRQVLND